MKPTDYPLLVIWSEEDQAYLARAIDLAGCVADGETPEAAIANAEIVIQQWLETAAELGRPIPEPLDDAKFRESLEAGVEAQQEEFVEAVSAAAREMVDAMLPQIINMARKRGHESASRPAHGAGLILRRRQLV